MSARLVTIRSADGLYEMEVHWRTDGVLFETRRIYQDGSGRRRVVSSMLVSEEAGRRIAAILPWPPGGAPGRR